MSLTELVVNFGNVRGQQHRHHLREACECRVLANNHKQSVASVALAVVHATL